MKDFRRGFIATTLEEYLCENIEFLLDKEDDEYNHISNDYGIGDIDKVHSDSRIRYFDGPQFLEKYCHRRGKTLWKGSFFYQNRDDFNWEGVSDIHQYGEGSYFCITSNCQDHYGNNIGYRGSDEFGLSPLSKIAVGDWEYFLDHEDEIREACDGFFDPGYDTFGLVVWNREMVFKT